MNRRQSLGGGARGFSPLKGKNVVSFPCPMGEENSSWRAKARLTPAGEGATSSVRPNGFTLAEVLITLGIIGVIAAMTLPTLIQRQNEKATVAKLKKVYSTLSQAYIFATEKNGPIEDWGFLTTDDSGNNGMSNPLNHELAAKKFIPYLKVTQECDGSNTTGVCAYVDSRVYYKAFLADGTVLSFRIYDPKCAYNHNVGTSKALTSICGEIQAELKFKRQVEYNGERKYYGQSLFIFYITKYGIVPMGTQDDMMSFERGCSANGSLGDFSDEKYVSCAAWVIINENMDYLKCDDLSWNGKTKCSQ